MSQVQLDALITAAVKVVESDAGLRELFDRLNAIYWHGRCGVEVVEWGDSGMHPKLAGEYLIDSKTIQINPNLRPNARGLVQTLIHEMCHYFYLGHGEDFLAELDRLSSLGCDLAAEDAAIYRKGSRIRDECESILDGWANAEGSVPNDLDRVYGYLSDRLGWEENELHDELSGEALSQLIRESNARYAQ